MHLSPKFIDVITVGVCFGKSLRIDLLSRSNQNIFTCSRIKHIDRSHYGLLDTKNAGAWIGISPAFVSSESWKYQVCPLICFVFSCGNGDDLSFLHCLIEPKALG